MKLSKCNHLPLTYLYVHLQFIKMMKLCEIVCDTDIYIRGISRISAKWYQPFIYQWYMSKLYYIIDNNIHIVLFVLSSILCYHLRDYEGVTV